MTYCCSEFRIRAEVSVAFERQDDGIWAIKGRTQCYVITGMKFCPFCGQSLNWIDHIVKPTGHGWAVWSRGARGAYFHTEEEAENHAKMLRQV